jgi:hypothetical protein
MLNRPSSIRTFEAGEGEHGRLRSAAMRAGDAHFGTAIVVIGICISAMVLGWNIAHFSLAMMNVDLSKRRIDAAAWASVPGLASTARQAEMMDKINPSDLTAANDRREALSAFLSIKPLSAYHWLLLSGVDFATAQRMDDVLDALMLSALTGPNEGYVMVERGIFGLSVWEDLPPDLKSRVAADLTAERITDNPNLRAVLSSKPQKVRNELRAALLALGRLPKDVERLGL